MAKRQKEKQSWFAGPYPWLVSTIAFLLPSINYFSKGDITGGTIFLISTVLFFINFLGRTKKKN
jgi:hypothetical protein